MGKAAIKTAPERDEVAPVWRIYAGKQQSAPREHESSRLGQLRSSNEPACSGPDASCLFESSPRIHFSLMRSSRLSAIFQTAAGMRPAVFFHCSHPGFPATAISTVVATGSEHQTQGFRKMVNTGNLILPQTSISHGTDFSSRQSIRDQLALQTEVTRAHWLQSQQDPARGETALKDTALKDTALKDTAQLSRRSFLQRSTAALSGAVMAAPLLESTARHARGDAHQAVSPWGPLTPQKDQSTGCTLCALPEGFQYWSFGWTDDYLDGASDVPARPTPNMHDGMGVIDQFGSRTVLVRNHEVSEEAGSFADKSTTYSSIAGGGTTTLIWNAETHTVESQFASMGGTLRNCAGGVTPWGTWLTCEETYATGTKGSKHGYVFEVAPAGGVPKPILGMGRFKHEATAVDEAGTIYLTEDARYAGFYRYLPWVLGNVAAGGRLQMLTVAGKNNRCFNFDQPFNVPNSWEIDWVDVPAPHELGTFSRTSKRGGARFTRLEGCWASDDFKQIFFLSTDGGVASKGQIFCYDVQEQKLTIIFDALAENVADYPDNFTITPGGGFLLCEDHLPDKSTMPQRLLGMAPDGNVFPFAENRCVFEKPYRRAEGGYKTSFAGDFSKSEWAGACFSKDGQWLFVNIQTPGVTLAITGPWKDGAL